jgi:hypothetical protein
LVAKPLDESEPLSSRGLSFQFDGSLAGRRSQCPGGKRAEDIEEMNSLVLAFFDVYLKGQGSFTAEEME